MKNLLVAIFIFAAFGAAKAQTAGTLTVTFSTNGGAKVCPAIFITNSSGGLVNTLFYNTKNGDGSASDMTLWWSKVGPSWPSSKLLTTTDAITGATSSSNFTNQLVYWGKTASVASVTDGTYTVNFEISYYSPTSRKYYSTTFVKGSSVSTGSITGGSGFTNGTVSWTPTNTAVNQVNLEKQYVAYPNPTRSTVYMSGLDIQQIELCTLAGNRIFVTNQQKMDLTRLPKGVYIANVTTNLGTFTKKIEKL